MKNRKEVILSTLDLSGQGLEIGASHNPLTPKREGYNVETIDHLDQAGLKQKYANDPMVCIDNIEEVNYVWTGQRYAELTGKRNHYSWIIASHVVEHVPDLVSFLQNCAEVLKDGGVLALAVPDMRCCFDQFRQPSDLSKVLNAYHNKHTRHPSGDVLDYFLNTSTKRGRITWSVKDKGRNEFMFSQESALEKYNQSLAGDEYIDIHAWCFTPNSFRLLMHDLGMLGLIPYQEIDFRNRTRSFEFYLALKKTSEFHPRNRMELLEACKEDLYEPYIAQKQPWKHWFSKEYRR